MRARVGNFGCGILAPVVIAQNRDKRHRQTLGVVNVLELELPLRVVHARNAGFVEVIADQSHPSHRIGWGMSLGVARHRVGDFFLLQTARTPIAYHQKVQRFVGRLRLNGFAAHQKERRTNQCKVQLFHGSLEVGSTERVSKAIAPPGAMEISVQFAFGFEITMGIANRVSQTEATRRVRGASALAWLRNAASKVVLSASKKRRRE